MLTYALYGIGILIVGFIILVAMQPSYFRIARSLKIKARPADIFPHINNLHKMQVWSPWEKMDPDMERVYEGPDEGPGAIYRWNGNNKIGEGRMTIVDSRANDIVAIKLEFIRPFQCSNDVDFTIKPDGDDSVVTWTMAGRNKFINKAMCLVMNMDKMCGGQFEEGLAQLKTIVEDGAPEQPTTGGVVFDLPATEPLA